jgi:pyruvate/2-oxoglutarate dehydrogenase complex dihydrolipoamide acyltransferase (E2) component
MSVDFASLMQQAGPMEAIPVGDYDVVVKDAQATESKNTGKPMVKCKFAIESGPHANRTLWWNAVISQESPEALAIFFRQMDALGLGSTFFAASPSMEQVAQNLVGKRARINVAHRMYNGANQPDIKRVSAPLGGNGGLGGPLAATPSSPSPAVTPAPPAPPAPQPVQPSQPSAPAPQPSAPAPQPQAETPAGVDIGEGTSEQPAGLPPKTPF